MNVWIIGGIAGCVVVAVAFVTLRMLRSTAASGGADKEAKRQLEEMTRREKKADEIKAQPDPIDLAAQLRVMRERLRKKMGRDGN